MRIGVLAHAGDGNLHPLIMTDLRDREEMARVDKAMEELYEAAIGMGGTLSGEHGIGIAKDRFMGCRLAFGTGFVNWDSGLAATTRY